MTRTKQNTIFWLVALFLVLIPYLIFLPKFIGVKTVIPPSLIWGYPVLITAALYIFEKYFSGRNFGTWLVRVFVMGQVVPFIFTLLSVGNEPACDAKYGPDYNCYPHARDARINLFFGFAFFAVVAWMVIPIIFYNVLAKKKGVWKIEYRALGTLALYYGFPMLLPLIVGLLF